MEVKEKHFLIDNGTPKGSMISPILFSIMINDVFSVLNWDIGKSLFADYGALWKKGKNLTIIQGKIQETVRMGIGWLRVGHTLYYFNKISSSLWKCSISISSKDITE